jgi:filamentous hemagglutinin
LKGEAAGQDYMQKNGFEKISSEKGWNAPGVDDIWKNPNPPPDYVVTEYKYGSSSLGSTKDGVQMSDDWLAGVSTGKNRIDSALGIEDALNVNESMKAGAVEKWLLRVDEAGNLTKQVLDSAAKSVGKGP